MLEKEKFIDILKVTAKDKMNSQKETTAIQTYFSLGKTFEYENKKKVRIIEIKGEVWFVAKDVTDILGYSRRMNAMRILDEDERGTHKVSTPKGNQEMSIINESGLYHLVLSSKGDESKKFRRWITGEVLPSIRKSGQYAIKEYAPTHKFIRRFNLNWDRVDKGYFSVISELFIRVHGKLEMAGCLIPEKNNITEKEIRVDVSVGKHWVKYLEENEPKKLDLRKPYKHLFLNRMEVDAWQYPMDLLSLFIKFVDDEWLPKKSGQYFKQRAPIVLEYLPKIVLLDPKNPSKKAKFQPKKIVQ